MLALFNEYHIQKKGAREFGFMFLLETFFKNKKENTKKVGEMAISGMEGV